MKIELNSRKKEDRKKNQINLCCRKENKRKQKQKMSHKTLLLISVDNLIYNLIKQFSRLTNSDFFSNQINEYADTHTHTDRQSGIRIHLVEELLYYLKSHHITFTLLVISIQFQLLLKCVDNLQLFCYR